MCLLASPLRGVIQDALLGISVYRAIDCVPCVTHDWAPVVRPSRACGEFILRTVVQMNATEMAHATLALCPGDVDAAEMCLFMGNALPAVVRRAEDRVLCMRFASIMWLWLVCTRAYVTASFVSSPSMEMLSGFTTAEWAFFTDMFRGSASPDIRVLLRANIAISEICYTPAKCLPGTGSGVCAELPGGVSTAEPVTVDRPVGTLCAEFAHVDVDGQMQSALDAQSAKTCVRLVACPETALASQSGQDARNSPVRSARRQKVLKQSNVLSIESMLPFARVRPKRQRRRPARTRKERTASEAGNTVGWKLLSCKDFNIYCTDNGLSTQEVHAMRKDRRRFMNKLYSRINRQNRNNRRREQPSTVERRLS